MHTETVPRTEEIAQRTTGVHGAQCHRITAVSSLPVASSSAACLVLTTSHPYVLAGPGLLVIYDICYLAPAAWHYQSVRPASPLA